MKGKIQCVYHGAVLDGASNFYLASDESLYRGIGRIPVCKKCIKEIVEQLYKEYDDSRLAIFHTCRKLDIPFEQGHYDGAVRGTNDIFQVFQRYIRQINSIGSSGNFDTGEDIRIEMADKQEADNAKEYEQTSKLNNNDKYNKEQVIDLLGYDPFLGMSSIDQKFLYNDLINYLHDENVVDNQFLVSQIIQITINNNQIRVLDDAISHLTRTSEDVQTSSGKISALNKMKKDLVDSTAKIAKENKISGGNMGGKTTLTQTIEKLVELDFEEAEVSFYDERLTRGMQRASDISTKSMMQFLELDEADTTEIIMEQRRLVENYQKKILELEEQNRKAYVEISKLKVDEDE